MRQGGRLGFGHAIDTLCRLAFLAATAAKQLPVRHLLRNPLWQAEQGRPAMAKVPPRRARRLPENSHRAIDIIWV